MNIVYFQQMDLGSQFQYVLNIIEPQITHFHIQSGNNRLSFDSLIKSFIDEYEHDAGEKMEFEHLLEFQEFVDEKCDHLFVALPIQETIKRSIERVIAAYSKEAIFIGDHHHIYQPQRFDPEFAEYVHEKISQECYERMSRLYRFYSVDIGPTLSEWFRTCRPDIFESLAKSHEIEPLIPQAFTHRILPLIREDEDLRAEILAGILYHERTFGFPEDMGPKGIWLPECCVNERVARHIAKSGIDFIILRSDQSSSVINPAKVYEMRLSEEEGKESQLTVFYYQPFSREFSFDKWTTDNPSQTLQSFLAYAEKDQYYLLAHDGELVHHRFEHLGVDVTGFFRELPLEIYRKSNPALILISPGRYLKFLHVRSALTGEPVRLSHCELPDFPTSWSCGGYGLRTFFEEKGESLESLASKEESKILESYAEFLILRDLQRSDYDPVQEDSWKLMVKMKLEEIQEKYGEKLSSSDREAILEDLRRGVNICYDNRRYLGMKIAGAGRWAFGSLDSGDSTYQTYLLAACSELESQIQGLFCRRTEGLFKDGATLKAVFLAHSIEQLCDLKGSPGERLKLLNSHYNGTVTERELPYFRTKDEFLSEQLISPETVDAPRREEIFRLLCLWSLVRAAHTSCAYFFDDLNNHVSEDAVLRAAEAIFQIEDTYRERISQEVYENLKLCRSRYRTARGQGPEVSAYEIAMRHLNLLRISNNITRFEEISHDMLKAYLKDNPYSLPHPEGSSREYYRALIDDELIGFTSSDGVELLFSKMSKEAARTARDIHVVVEKRDLETGEIINRLKLEVKYDQLVAEKPYAPSALDPNIYISIKIDDREWALISNMVNNTILPLLSDYGIDSRRVSTTFVQKDRFIFDYSDPGGRSRRKGPSRHCDALILKKGVNLAQFTKFGTDLRFILKEKEKLLAETPGIESVNPLWMEKLPGHLERLMRDHRTQLIIYGYEGNPGLLKSIEKAKPGTLETIIEGSCDELKQTPYHLNVDLIKTFVLNRLFLSRDFAMGKYEIEQKVRNKRRITMKEAVQEYCGNERIPYVEEMLNFKLWKYRSQEIRRYWKLLKEEEKLRRFLHHSLVFRTGKDEQEEFHLITHPIIYLHGAANEVNNEAFYPDNEVIPRVAETVPENNINICFFPGSVAFVDQYSYLKKIRRYLGEKFGLGGIHGALFATGERHEIDKIMEKEEQIFVLPSVTHDYMPNAFPKERIRQISSRHLEFNFGPELEMLKSYLEGCHIIYLGGGHSYLLNYRLCELILPGEIPFKEYLGGFLFRGGLLMGLSAGTMVLGMRNITYKLKKMQISNDVEALEVARGNLQVHFEEYGLPDHLKEIKSNYEDLPAIGIDTHTGLIDFITMKIIASDSPLRNNGHPDAIKRTELLNERLVVMGEKSLSLKTGSTSIFLDGQELNLPGAFFNFEKYAKAQSDRQVVKA